MLGRIWVQGRDLVKFAAQAHKAKKLTKTDNRQRDKFLLRKFLVFIEPLLLPIAEMPRVRSFNCLWKPGPLVLSTTIYMFSRPILSCALIQVPI
jgi:hypothetical protein